MPQLLLATRALARRADRAEIDLCALAAGRGVPGGIGSLEVGGGRALCGLPGSPFNKVLGLGLDGPVSDAELDALVAFYAERNAPAQVELCPLAQHDLPPRLAARGFIVQGFENELARHLPMPDLPPSPLRVERVVPERDEQWVRVALESFGAPERGTPLPPDAPAAIEQAMRQFVEPVVTRYLAWVDGEPAGCASTFLHEGTLGIAGTATLPRFRRRGVQTAVVQVAIADSGGDADLAIATTEPGSTSQRTFERLGFQVAYTRVIFVRPAPC